MFYYPAVLRYRTGCFSTIWQVATRGTRVPRRDFLKVNVIRTCVDVMSYVLEQVPPPYPGLPRPRFSLYLSSQLQYGIILVYHRQCAILLEELHHTLKQLLKQRLGQKIDLDDQTKRGACHCPQIRGTESHNHYGGHVRFLSDLHQILSHPSLQFEGAELPEQLSDILDLLMAQTDYFEGVQRIFETREAPPTVLKKKRGRQLIFFDPETQIPNEELENQINQPMTETRPLPIILSLPPPTAAELFTRPCTFTNLMCVCVCVCWQVSCVQVCFCSGGHTRGGGRVSADWRVRQCPVQNLCPQFRSGEPDGVCVCVCVCVCWFRSLPPEPASAPLLFHSLLPPEANRRTVSTIFRRLLGKGSVSVLAESCHYSS
uniref:Rad21/Rec8-like protein N-terminal domain-containing protein n=1 Tax=Cynoglossus semilaevis TaxID=244447 RepID=A0A3P8UWY6_CYNSE